MKKIMNGPEKIVDQMLQGFAFARADKVGYDPLHRVLYQKTFDPKSVPIISGGGSGHEPGHLGYVGEGMLAAAVHGDVFVPPSAQQVLAAIRQMDQGKGVLLIIKNFVADLATFLSAEVQARAEGRDVAHVIVNDDVSVESDASFEKRRRGVAGAVLVHKIIGAAAKEGYSLEALKEVGEQVVKNLATLGVALTHADLPERREPQFLLEEGEVYFGVGIHGEQGYRKEKLVSSELLAVELVNKLKSLYRWDKNDQYAVLINGLGGTPLIEQYVFANDVRRLLAIENLHVSFVKVGTQLTSLNMKGISLTMLKICDEQWVKWLYAPVDVAHWA
ncbi:DhaKLM operon coactivator DhaQ [Halalkalibacterium halodurans]|uniref:DhaKLM operon coactivator DhaQ n=1 Tax=Halalkalibacterium halodurans TaxID=86665 RepID=UPI002E1EFBFF|nr:DhaKLM operon coactivator DhaQ [Halalkalibacterium halodurans]MED4080669.1 DhaKLM operon coactivator DhaQ [Halalkalibacterium halodurans]MED4085644.1 DhaKLM operon coactivator DhaQ [Halalkalibacterium halodurans]MED4106356.1 DhaKLM operon coactivator DhaQ [Halalkalibacterium halodurans]MED4108552.1 DhaKLM operon coactivator DhaQ [Halalkalibacterium halodurans]MED4124768.1 DhaKLM operon coactivator DhaQ [Halalkalibacterium halodurans]